MWHIIQLCVCVFVLVSPVAAVKFVEGDATAGFGAPQQNVPASEIEALYALYNATDGPNWHWLNISDGVPWVFNPDANPCKDNWQGIECPPVPPYNVISITLADQQLKGTLPSEIGNFTKLGSLHIAHSKELKGTLPESLGKLTALLSLEISRSSVSGTVPASLVNLRTIHTLLLFGNNLVGPIPEFVCSLATMTALDFSFNIMTGTIPQCLCNVTALEHGLALSNNKLSGTIPACLGNLTALHDLDISSNQLTGTIPESLGNITALWYFIVYNNQLSGAIPVSLGHLPEFIGFYAYTNSLTGPIPESYAHLSLLRTLDLNANLLSGTFPQFMHRMVSLVDIALYENGFSGTLPDSITELASLAYLEVYACHLTGSLPDEMGAMESMKYLQLYDNGFTGSIPVSVVNITGLLTLLITGNSLTGSIPKDLGRLEQLQYLWLDDNLLEGTVPRSLSSVIALQELFLSNNRLTGSLYGVFDPQTQLRLQTIQLSGNQLSGSLPRSVYALPALNTFAAVSNCFVTTLTEEVCACASLVTLALDGLQSSSKCQQKLLGGVSDSYAVARPMKGGIPTCLFSMPQINTLHLSGNGLSGSLPPDLTVAPSLVDLSLSHNSLTGTIPPQLQERQWYNLDLSFNRLTGTLSPRFAAQRLNYSRYIQFGNVSDPSDRTAYTLNNNRLSGSIPGFLHSVLNVSVLGTNMFSCDVTGSELPANDSGGSKYTCGSDAFNTPYYVWLGLVVCAVAAIGAPLVVRGGTGKSGWKALYDRARGWLRVADGGSAEDGDGNGNGNGSHAVARVPSLRGVMFTFDASCSLTSLTVGYQLLVLLPLYLGISYRAGTFTHMYAWGASAAFLSGRLATGLVMGLLLALLALVTAFAHRRCAGYRGEDHRYSSRSVSSSAVEPQSLRQRIAACALFMTSSFLVVVGVNVAYVYVVLYATHRILLLSQILLSFFKLFWNKVCATYLMRWTASAVHRAADEGVGSGMRDRDLTFVLLLVTLVNNIAIPCLVVAVVSPSCFYNVFVPAPSVNATYTYEYCALINDVSGECIFSPPALGGTRYNPPFSYSYQCSSSFVTYYAPAFVFLCITATVLTPLSEAAALWVHTRWPPCVRGGLYHQLLQSFLPRILRPLGGDDSSAPAAKRDVYHPYFDANRRLVTLFSYLGVLVTFGAVFPPLGVAVAVTVYVSAATEKLKLGRFLSLAQEQGQGSTAHATILEAECRRAGGADVLLMAVHMIAAFACWFYTLFLFDTLGDAVGFEGAYWVLIVVPALPVVVYVASVAAPYMRIKRTGAGAGGGRGGDRQASTAEGGALGITLSPMVAGALGVTLEDADVVSADSVA